MFSLRFVWVHFGTPREKWNTTNARNGWKMDDGGAGDVHPNNYEKIFCLWRFGEWKAPEATELKRKNEIFEKTIFTFRLSPLFDSLIFVFPFSTFPPCECMTCGGKYPAVSQQHLDWMRESEPFKKKLSSLIVRHWILTGFTVQRRAVHRFLRVFALFDWIKHIRVEIKPNQSEGGAFPLGIYLHHPHYIWIFASRTPSRLRIAISVVAKA